MFARGRPLGCVVESAACWEAQASPLPLASAWPMGQICQGGLRPQLICKERGPRGSGHESLVILVVGSFILPGVEPAWRSLRPEGRWKHVSVGERSAARCIFRGRGGSRGALDAAQLACRGLRFRRRARSRSPRRQSRPCRPRATSLSCRSRPTPVDILCSSLLSGGTIGASKASYHDISIQHALRQGHARWFAPAAMCTSRS